MSEYHRRLRELATTLGWKLSKTNGSHLRLTHPEIKEHVIASSTPRCDGVSKIEADLKRAMRRAGLLCNSSTATAKGTAPSRPFSHIPKTTPAERRQRRPEACRKMAFHQPTGSLAQLDAR